MKKVKTFVALCLIFSFLFNIGFMQPVLAESTPPLASSVEISAKDGRTVIGAGETVQLSAVVLPDGAPQEVAWTSETESAAAVDALGLVIAVSEGTAIIKATAKDGSGISGELTITVTAPASPSPVQTPFESTPTPVPPSKLANAGARNHANAGARTNDESPGKYYYRYKLETGVGGKRRRYRLGWRYQQR